MKGCLGLLNTEHYAYGDLFNEMNLVTGGMAAVNNVYGKLQDMDQFILTLELKTKVFYDRLAEAIDLMREIVMTSDLRMPRDCMRFWRRASPGCRHR